MVRTCAYVSKYTAISVSFYYVYLKIKAYCCRRKALRTLCERPDAQKSKGGLSALPNDIILMVTRDLTHWDLTNQFIRFCKPLVDAIGNLESRDATLADCMLELLRCAKHLNEIENLPTDDTGFTQHARTTFNQQFLTMNTNLHWFALYLHPQCRRLAVSQKAKSRTFSDAVDVALSLAKKWKWSEQSAMGLLKNLRDYNIARKPFTGGLKNARIWWEELPVTGQECPLKSLALILFGLVPHSAEVERLFSSLGGIQGVRRSRLDVRTFERLGRVRCHLNSLLHEKAAAEGRTLRRTRAHMHTRPGGGIDEELIAQLEQDLTIRPVLSSVLQGDDSELAEREEVSLGGLEAAFEEIEGPASVPIANDNLEEIDRIQASLNTADVGGLHIGDIFDFSELQQVLDGTLPMVIEENHRVHHNFEGGEVTWDKESLMRKGGI